MLYFRQILIMLVSLYTVRVVLETLGAEDYGIYNVVAGVVTMLGFLSGSMASASQRYFSFELGRGDFEQLKKVFSLSLLIYVLITLIVLLLAETIGLWFVNTKLIIPPERMGAARWIYQFSIISFVFTIMASPFMAAIIAREDMNIYAAVSIVEAVLKLSVVFLLKIIALDKLQLYGILLCAVTVINTGIYRAICRLKYQECKFRFYWDRELFKEITSFTGWNLFGSAAGVFKNQAVNILLNQFFNPLVITARSIALSVNMAVSSFFQNFTLAVRPQITKTYALNNVMEMISLLNRYTKITYFLIYILAFPLILELPIIFSLWLKNVPEYTVLFTRLVLIDAVIDSLNYPVGATAQATGKIKLYQSITSGILILNLPISWISLAFGVPAYSVFIIAIIMSITTFIIRMMLLKYLVADYSIKNFLISAIVPIIKVSILSSVPTLIIFTTAKSGLLRLCLVIFVNLASSCGFMYLLGLTNTEKKKLKNHWKQNHKT
jgi:O-antigen/teichoic acid export membrane protein